MKKISLLSGEGGTGKTTVAIGLSKYVNNSALLDLDITAPDIPVYVKGEVQLGDEGVIHPVENDGIKYFSVGYLGDDPITWSSERIEDLIGELFKEVAWGNTDYLFVDCPPGIAPEVQAILPLVDATILVTNPTALSYSDIKRTIELLKDEEVPIAGEIRNMAYYQCPNCGHTDHIFGYYQNFTLEIPLICEIPIVKMPGNLIPREFLPVEKILNAIKKPYVVKKSKLKRYIIKRILEW